MIKTLFITGLNQNRLQRYDKFVELPNFFDFFVRKMHFLVIYV